MLAAALDGLYVEKTEASKGEDGEHASVPLSKVAQISVKDASSLQVTVFEAAVS
jgi:ribosome recycling factor